MYLGIHRKEPARTPIVLRRALILGLVMSLLTAGIALADNLEIDGDGLVPVVSNPTINLGSICVGQSASGNALLAIKRVGGGALQNVFSNSSNVTVSAGTPSDPNVSTSFSDYGIALPGNWTAAINNTMSSDTATSQVTATAAGLAGPKSATVVFTASGTRASDGASLSRTATLTINWTVAVCDTTPPVITPSVSGTLGNNGWYVSDVTVSWTVTDPESTITSSTGCGPTTINADTAGQTLTCSATSAGGPASESVTIKRDATAPTISGSASPVPNGAGWNNTDVTVSFSCDDDTSGVASCGPNQTLSDEGSGQSASGTAVDNAGNSASTTVSGIKIDRTPPVASVTGVTNGATYTLGSVPAAGCSTTDLLSGVAKYASLAMSGGPVVGSFTATCDGAVDNAGNTATASAAYSVIYNFAGFFRPVDNWPVWNQVKAGSAIPVKFSLSGNQGLSIFAANFPKSQVVACATSDLVDIIEETVTAGGSSLSYDPLADQYVYVWKTERAWTGCRQLQVKFIDGTIQTAMFKFTK